MYRRLAAILLILALAAPSIAAIGIQVPPELEETQHLDVGERESYSVRVVGDSSAKVIDFFVELRSGIATVEGQERKYTQTATIEKQELQEFTFTLEGASEGEGVVEYGFVTRTDESGNIGFVDEKRLQFNLEVDGDAQTESTESTEEWERDAQNGGTGSTGQQETGTDTKDDSEENSEENREWMEDTSPQGSSLTQITNPTTDNQQNERNTAARTPSADGKNIVLIVGGLAFITMLLGIGVIRMGKKNDIL